MSEFYSQLRQKERKWENLTLCWVSKRANEKIWLIFEIEREEMREFDSLLRFKERNWDNSIYCWD